MVLGVLLAVSASRKPWARSRIQSCNVSQVGIGPLTTFSTAHPPKIQMHTARRHLIRAATRPSTAEIPLCSSSCRGRIQAAFLQPRSSAAPFHTSSRRRDEMPRSPYQIFVETLKEELQKNKELQENVKTLQGDVDKLQDSESMKRAKEMYERARVSLYCTEWNPPSSPLTPH